MLHSKPPAQEEIAAPSDWERTGGLELARTNASRSEDLFSNKHRFPPPKGIERESGRSCWRKRRRRQTARFVPCRPRAPEQITQSRAPLASWTRKLRRMKISAPSESTWKVST